MVGEEAPTNVLERIDAGKLHTALGNAVLINQLEVGFSIPCETVPWVTAILLLLCVYAVIARRSQSDGSAGSRPCSGTGFQPTQAAAGEETTAEEDPGVCVFRIGAWLCIFGYDHVFLPFVNCA